MRRGGLSAQREMERVDNMNEPWSHLGFGPADVLLPREEAADLTRWSVVACDQYTSEPEYWQRVEQTVGDAPSALKLILPEQKLSDGHTEEHIAAINAEMERYLERDLFRALPDSLIYVERRLNNGALRRGIVGQIDLEDYDYNPGASTLIRATERTVLSRIPPRVAVRRSAALELPHVMLLVDDPDCSAIEPLTAETDQMEEIYDFDLMEQGGHITGYLMGEEQMFEVASALSALADQGEFERRYDAEGKPLLLFAVGDGNHSLASAKANYEEKKGTPEAEKARYALVELVNLHDESLEFEPIHRVCFGVDGEAMLNALLERYPGAHTGTGRGQQFELLCDGEKTVVTIPNAPSQLAVGTLQAFLDDYLPTVNGTVDYIHGADVVERLCAQEHTVGFLLPAMGKDELFPTVVHDGVLPRKTFSMGEACDKRFYLEARKIR